MITKEENPGRIIKFYLVSKESNGVLSGVKLLQEGSIIYDHKQGDMIWAP